MDKTQNAIDLLKEYKQDHIINLYKKGEAYGWFRKTSRYIRTKDKSWMG